MAKIVFALGLDVDLFQKIEELRKETPRATYINRTLRDVLLGTVNDEKYQVVNALVEKFKITKHEAMEIVNMSEREYYEHQKKEENTIQK